MKQKLDCMSPFNCDTTLLLLAPVDHWELWQTHPLLRGWTFAMALPIDSNIWPGWSSDDPNSLYFVDDREMMHALIIGPDRTTCVSR